MTQFVRKTLLGGFAEVPGGQNDPECSHVLMERADYDGLCRCVSDARQEAMRIRNG